MQLPHKVGLAGVLVTLVGIIFGWGIFPPLLTSQIGKIKGLAPDSESRQFWERAPFFLDFKIYLFNVTNPLGVQKGELPHVQEVGPYYFDELKEKSEIIDYEEDDTVSFFMKNTFTLNKKKSAPLTGNELLTMGHPLLLGMIYSADRTRPSALGMVNKAIPNLFNHPESVFITTTPLDYLFNGLTVNCTVKEFQSIAICSVLKKDVKDLLPSDKTNIYLYSIFGAKNGTSDPNKFRVYRGIKDPQKVGEVVTLNGKNRLNLWRGRPCNDLQGTDSTVFPPGLQRGDPVWSYTVDICRSLPGIYVGESKFKGVESYLYEVDLGDMSSEPSLKCYCPNASNCLKQGAFDLMPCTGAPILATLPHFYNAHEDYQKKVHGMNPSAENHSIKFQLEPYTGTPLYAKKRLMFSIPIYKVKQVALTENVADTIIPLFWVEESLELNDQFIAKLDSELFRIIRIVDIIKWMLATIGTVFAVGGVGLYYKKKNAMMVTPTSSVSKRTETPDDYANRKKTQGLDMDMGHTNFGYI